MSATVPQQQQQNKNLPQEVKKTKTWVCMIIEYFFFVHEKNWLVTILCDQLCNSRLNIRFYCDRMFCCLIFPCSLWLD